MKVIAKEYVFVRENNAAYEAGEEFEVKLEIAERLEKEGKIEAIKQKKEEKETKKSK